MQESKVMQSFAEQVYMLLTKYIDNCEDIRDINILKSARRQFIANYQKEEYQETQSQGE